MATVSMRARSWETSTMVPSKASRASSSASRLSVSRWFVGSSSTSRLPPFAISDDQRQPTALAARQAVHPHVGRLAGEEEAAEQGAGLRLGQVAADQHRLDDGPRLVQVLAVLGEVRRAHPVPHRHPAARGRALADEGLQQRRLARAVRRHDREALPALQREAGAVDQAAARGPPRRGRPPRPPPGRCAPPWGSRTPGATGAAASPPGRSGRAASGATRPGGPWCRRASG